jgi:hypothetical protein
MKKEFLINEFGIKFEFKGELKSLRIRIYSHSDGRSELSMDNPDNPYESGYWDRMMGGNLNLYGIELDYDNEKDYLNLERLIYREIIKESPYFFDDYINHKMDNEFNSLKIFNPE